MLLNSQLQRTNGKTSWENIPKISPPMLQQLQVCIVVKKGKIHTQPVAESAPAVSNLAPEKIKASLGFCISTASMRVTPPQRAYLKGSPVYQKITRLPGGLNAVTRLPVTQSMS